MIVEPSSQPGLPLVSVDGSRYDGLADWLSQNPRWGQQLHAQGYILLRGFGVVEPDLFDAALDLLMHPSTEFAEETSPRSSVGERIFTSTDYPQHYPIQFHHEFSYRASYPDLVAFCCIRPAASGGATPIADSRRVLARLPPDVVGRFEALGISYYRNFNGLGVSWQDAFGTTDQQVVSDYCRRHNIVYSWSGDELHTAQTAPAIIGHPVTGERAWFNSVLNLNVSGIEPPAVRAAMEMLPTDTAPTNTAYGSGDPIEPSVIELLRQVYTAEALRFDWQRGDLLLIDNVLMAHARDPFLGERRVIVGMGQRISS